MASIWQVGPGEVPTALRYRPQLARLVRTPPAGDAWLHEMKFDGYRIGCRIQGRRVTLISRNGKDWTAAFPEVVEAARDLGVRQALIDGEVAILTPDGRTSFQTLQNAFSGGPRRGLVYLVFDLLHLDGQSLHHRPLDERKDALRALAGRRHARPRIRYSEHVIGRGRETFAEACRLGLEGIVSKRRDAPYKPGRADTWVKTKCVLRQEFVIGGFTDPEGTRVGIGSLVIGYYDDNGRLAFAGKVGTGFTTASARDLRRRLESVEQAECPFDPPPPGSLRRHGHWTTPRLIAEVAFTEWTEEGRIRHPSFQGLRTDKAPREVRRERAATPPGPGAGQPAAAFRLKAEATTDGSKAMSRRADGARVTGHASRRATGAARRGARAATGGTIVTRENAAADGANADGTRNRPRSSARVEVAGVSISHPDRVLYPDPPITKLDLARYYERIAGWIVPHVEGRPLTLVRCPDGIRDECFYMKHSKVWAPPAVRRVKIQEKTKVGEYLVADSVAAVVSLVQMGVLEIHTWNSRMPRVEHPDRIVLDIDPGDVVPWGSVIEAARLLRALLAAVDLQSFVKTTGGKGLHVVVPLRPHADWRQCLEFSRAAAEAIVRHDPALFTTAFAKAGRERKILIDYLRNNRTNTSVAAFSSRARPGAPVSVPLRWDEVVPKLAPASWSVATVEKRLARLKQDPWRSYWTSRQRLTPSMLAAVDAFGSGRRSLRP